ncbi:transcription factor SPT20 homolog [Pipistrellus kuhlii]|uniref:transcription factor SPT20 homolog n=1 Tax=Pipistrellus kuhlii TaxID=59472 RepID=UPI00174F11A7|nr:transcription factor SPT20 homolog [Pipistrellus kuhlii]
MQRALERAVDRAGRVIEGAQQRPPKRKAASAEGKSLQEKLYDIYVEECGREPEGPEELMRNVHLLEKLVKRESPPCLLVNLLPGEKEYSLVLRVETETYLETVLLPYHDSDFLQYLDAEMLCPDLVDVLEKSQVDIFQSGCVITEVRDYRRCTHSDCSAFRSRHVLLRPTMQTLASDVQSITSDGQIWTQEDRLSLENQPILATAEPLCLDPSLSVACIENQPLYNKQKMNAPPMKRSLQDCSAASLDPQPEVSHSPSPPELKARAPDQKSEESQADRLDDLGIIKDGYLVDDWEQLLVDWDFPSKVDMDKYSNDEDSVEYDDAQPTVWPTLEEQDDSLFGREAGNLSQATKPTVMKSLNDPFISGRRPRKKVRGGRPMSHLPSFQNDHSYSSVSGSKPGAAKAARQSEESGKQRICPVRVPRGSRGFTRLSQLCPGRAAEQPQAVSTPSAAPGKEGQRTPPALSRPCSSGKSSSGKPLPSQQPPRVRALPSPAPACQPSRLPKKSSAQGKRVRTLPAATVSSARASRITPFIQVKHSAVDPKVVQLIGPVRIVQTVVREHNPAQASSRGARAASGAKPSSLPSGGQPQNAGPAAPQAAPSGGVQYVLGNMSSLMPIRVLWVPEGSDISTILQQAQQPQQLLCHLVAQPPPAQPPASRLRQQARQVSRAQAPSSSPKGPPAQQAAAVINLNGVGGVLQPQQAPLSQPGSGQTRPGQRLVQLPSAFQQLPQSKPVQWQVVPLSKAEGTASVPPTQPGGGQQAAGQAKGKEKGGLPGSPKC